MLNSLLPSVTNSPATALNLPVPPLSIETFRSPSAAGAEPLSLTVLICTTRSRLNVYQA
jgi:hypothetical protein